MAYSTQRAVSDGTLREILLTIGFIDREDITVYVDNEPLVETGTIPSTDITYEWVTDNLIRFSEDIPDGLEVLIQRSTELGAVLNVFSAGASFDDPTMDENFRQLLYIAQEAREGATLAEVFHDIDMHGYQLLNLGTATEPGNAVPLHQMQAESTWAYQSRVAAEAAAATAVSARNAAQLSESNAAGSASSAAASASAASTSATNAAASAATAVANRNESQTFRNETKTFRDEAEGFRNDAANSALEAAGWAAGVNMPSGLGHGGEYLRQRPDETGLEYVPLQPFVRGMVVMWSGAIASIPDGWALCDGSNGTPDLRDRFIVGAGSTYAVGATGGANSVTLGVQHLPAHTHAASTAGAGGHAHSGTTSTAGAHTHTMTHYWTSSDTNGGRPRSALNDANARNIETSSAGAHTHTFTTSSVGNHTHTVSVSNTGGGQAHENRPPYYALAFIMKL